MTENEKLKNVDFTSNFTKDYHAYGMDVIKNRALPDARDGLKPVHRAILIEMLNSHYTSNHKYVKVNKISGAVIGTWHPHGDTAVSDALVGMAIPWQNSMPVVEIRGNQGSVFGDPHASGRYIEARLTQTGDAYGKELRKGIVPYQYNFDDTAMMPKVLPAQLPYLLINGDSGIGVGFSSNIPTHNPVEVITTFLKYVKNPKLSVKQLMKTLKGPDFYTKGKIINQNDLLNIYETGFGRLRVKGRMKYHAKNHTLQVYEIPATSAGFMDKLVDEITTATMETINAKGRKVPPKVKGVNSVANYSGKNGIDISIHLKRGSDPKVIEQNLFAKTRLETTMQFDFSALNSQQQLRRYSLKDYFKDYLKFQHYIIANEYKMKQKAINERLEIITGLLILQKVIDEVIDVARHANGKKELKHVLMTGDLITGIKANHKKSIQKFAFSESQANAIANLPIYKINRLDYSDLINEGKRINNDLEYVNSVINDTETRTKLIVQRHKDELKHLKGDEFARKTTITNEPYATATNVKVPETTLYVSFNKYHYLRISDKKFDNGIKTTNKHRLGFFDTHGVCWNIHLENEKTTSNQGKLINQMINQKDPIIGWTTNINAKNAHYGLFIYANGNVKLTDMRKFLTKSVSTKVSSGKTKIPLLKMIDVPENTKEIKINDNKFKFDDFSINGMSGHGKNMLKPKKDKKVFDLSDEFKIEFK